MQKAQSMVISGSRDKGGMKGANCLIPETRIFIEKDKKGSAYD